MHSSLLYRQLQPENCISFDKVSRGVGGGKAIGILNGVEEQLGGLGEGGNVCVGGHGRDNEWRKGGAGVARWSRAGQAAVVTQHNYHSRLVQGGRATVPRNLSCEPHIRGPISGTRKGTNARGIPCRFP